MVEKGPVAIEKGLELNPTGACIGKMGERVKSISHFIRPERIHIFNWTTDKKKLLLDLLSPVKPVKLITQKEEEWEIVISQPKFPPNLLAEKISKCLGIKIHVRSIAETEKDEILENKGKMFQEIGNYKNIAVRIAEE